MSEEVKAAIVRLRSSIQWAHADNVLYREEDAITTVLDALEEAEEKLAEIKAEVRWAGTSPLTTSLRNILRG